MPIYIQVVSLSSSHMQGTIFVSSFIKINHMDQPKRTEVDSCCGSVKQDSPDIRSCESHGVCLQVFLRVAGLLTLGRGLRATGLDC